MRRVEDAGIEFVVVTARPPRWMHGLLDVVGEHGIAICTNGAFIYDVANRVILAERTHPVGDRGRHRCAICATAIPGIGFAVETIDGYGQEQHYVNLHPMPDGSPIGPIEESA